MGAWGYKALESDEGLDVVGMVRDYIEHHQELTYIPLSNIVQKMKSKGFFGETIEDVDFFYDVSAMALAELYIDYLDNGEFCGHKSIHSQKQLMADEDSLAFILNYLKDIRDEMPDQYGEREMIELWRESENWLEWSSNLAYLIQRIELDISRLQQKE
ncbi:DUF4259 domain-containing protein [Lysinibacillus sp. fkY74-1]|uniref:DUF4259 domain-containing protein n=3 Tax=Lysinibacillus TaxID=400634 RepID=B1HQM2_LYSSC|nr:MULTISPECIES: DUF4259 domain-containing protein [Lysinibacillus]MBE5083946.1 DUF4259 domain-containing protein [Bacillus thuringiensis]ACA40759.1 hypothetical protein Bsph_3254 [Lysinibacillus sphaericus C3-41]AMO33272.1 hypothetical protein AR327_12895 [Lysinibacillus sphaericus]AMR91625.1 hypothetical protein A1T07_16320 [Lysinibacillus sphaericus]ANA45672.1 hypothetical protein A2J09_08980 [Lysinibacillus sphaericus]